jgi:hypothetical protein
MATRNTNKQGEYLPQFKLHDYKRHCQFFQIRLQSDRPVFTSVVSRK